MLFKQGLLSKSILSLFALIFTLNLHAEMSYDLESASGQKYPTGPDQMMTPGKLCTTPTEKRYAEGIDYCERNVTTDTKNAVIAAYDKQLGYQIRTMNRGDFKIDHFIPLSIGGANDTENLWPQHKSVYKYSDPLELQLSQLMVAGRIKQAEAIKLIKDCKYNLPRCSEISHSLSRISLDR